MIRAGFILIELSIALVCMTFVVYWFFAAQTKAIVLVQEAKTSYEAAQKLDTWYTHKHNSRHHTEGILAQHVPIPGAHITGMPVGFTTKHAGLGSVQLVSCKPAPHAQRSMTHMVPIYLAAQRDTI